MKSKENIVGFVRRSSFRLVAIIGIVLGLFLLATGIFAQTYQEIHSNPERDTGGVLPLPEIVFPKYPYQKYAGILVAIGSVLLVADLAFFWRIRKERTGSWPSEMVSHFKG